jgi:hypothetical protein
MSAAFIGTMFHPTSSNPPRFKKRHHIQSTQFQEEIIICPASAILDWMNRQSDLFLSFLLNQEA